MKIKSLATIALTAIATVSLAACGSKTESSDSAEKSGDKIVTKLDGTTAITFWHAMAGGQGEALEKITKEFMEKNPSIKVTLQNQSSYSDLQAKINSTLQSPKDLPTITQAYPGWLYSAASDDMLVDLDSYISNDTIGWGDQEKITSSLLEGAQIEGKQYGIPFNKSTEMLFYNADMLKEYGVEVPTTMEELKEAAKTIYEKSNGEVVGAGFDSLNNYYAIGMKNEGVDFNKDLKLTSKASKEVISYYGEGIDKGYFRVAGSDKYLSGPFANKKIAMYIGSSAGEAYTAKDTKGKFEYGVAARPSEYNLQQGTDIYMFANASAEQRTAAFEFMKYLASPDVQSEWALATGYMPVVDSVMNSDSYKNASDMKVPAAIADATKKLFSIPVEENADSAYSEMRVIMENIYANPFKDEDKIIKDSVSELEQVWNQ
ncbi:ABC transporter substrate-binding protein [Enterococcus italicus]|uniref:ABC transporter substrate-binding protein n=1 Tax=Enterococcus italicus TaxID=246144 RepID=UPI0028AD42F0|nr:ABC transporter substrate-binding protein [Enterococcus italicus]